MTVGRSCPPRQPKQEGCAERQKPSGRRTEFRVVAILFAVACLMTLPSGAFADAQFRMAAEAGTDFSERASYVDIGSSFNDPTEVFEGMHLEVITPHVLGFGLRGLIRFTEGVDSLADTSQSGWMFDWNGELFLSGHPFGGGKLVDPFLEIGCGVAGRYISSATYAGVWNEGDDGLWTYEWLDNPGNEVTNLSIFPFVAAGVAFDLSGFLIGARVSYRPVVASLVATPIAAYPLTRFHIDVFGGVAFGGHR